MASCTEIFHCLPVIKLLSQKLNDINVNTVTVTHKFWMDSDRKFSFVTLFRKLLKRSYCRGSSWDLSLLDGRL